MNPKVWVKIKSISCALFLMIGSGNFQFFEDNQTNGRRLYQNEKKERRRREMILISARLEKSVSGALWSFNLHIQIKRQSQISRHSSEKRQTSFIFIYLLLFDPHKAGFKCVEHKKNFFVCPKLNKLYIN